MTHLNLDLIREHLATCDRHEHACGPLLYEVEQQRLEIAKLRKELRETERELQIKHTVPYEGGAGLEDY